MKYFPITCKVFTGEGQINIIDTYGNSVLYDKNYQIRRDNWRYIIARINTMSGLLKDD